MRPTDKIALAHFEGKNLNDLNAEKTITQEFGALGIDFLRINLELNFRLNQLVKNKIQKQMDILDFRKIFSSLGLKTEMLQDELKTYSLIPEAIKIELEHKVGTPKNVYLKILDLEMRSLCNNLTFMEQNLGSLIVKDDEIKGWNDLDYMDFFKKIRAEEDQLFSKLIHEKACTIKSISFAKNLSVSRYNVWTYMLLMTGGLDPAKYALNFLRAPSFEPLQLIDLMTPYLDQK